MTSTTAAKRRRVRKGTQSCWQCKRRKTRCTFFAARAAAPGDGRLQGPCDGCRSRRTKCVSQEFEEDGAVSATTADEHHVQDVPPFTAWSTLKPPDLSRALASVWPPWDDLVRLTEWHGHSHNTFHGVICQSYETLWDSLRADSRENLLQGMLRPPSDAQAQHPVRLARRLLLLSKFLQAIGDKVNQGAGNLARSPTARKSLMHDAFEAATRLVTSDHRLVAGSLDGIECVMIEAMCHNNAGRLRAAWLTNRRAMLMAQMLRVHDQDTQQTGELPVLHTTTRHRIDPEIMWFRLVGTDWYLSMLLGLAPDSASLAEHPAWASSTTLARFSPLEQLERIMIAVAGRILIRQQRERQGQVVDQAQRREQLFEEDKRMQAAAKLMPPEWWAPFTDKEPAGPQDPADELQQILRVMGQFAYYQVLVQLHLPHMLSRGDEADLEVCDYSRATAAHACRTILSLFERMRAARAAGSTYCRGVDFVVFVAAVTLCIAHIDTRRRQQLARMYARRPLDALEHQRLADRALLDRTLGAMHHSPFVSSTDGSGGSDDVVAQKMAGVVQSLLMVEGEVAKDQHWEVYIVRGRKACHANDAMESVRVDIPNLGTIVLERISGQQAADLSPLPAAALSCAAMGDVDGCTLQGVDLALFTGMTEGLFGETTIVRVTSQYGRRHDS
ncbi:uncharacterized protein B0I36DRAFT_366877 [Microdochium trichocladiopsis]|uniref:Zn(2)-C6 fungal-type domain-containing protein n=1 Tax=Microdochium trichocladiopsis TaxID=1682393 RepID=A0A9P8XYP1_9PEZI|nr:uncharacterized protein B0I36DRAFT_366877 [Microdochium trichocladiopsis]KAH7024979.1 hypothetical protein B0I36DRAFT_366877 [Microdochium trichocladiopsis]